MRQWTLNWWALGVRSAAAIVLGIAALTWPGATLRAIVMMFGFYAIVDGMFAVVAAVRGLKASERWMPLLSEGLVGIFAGGIALFWPGIGALAVIYLIAGWGLATGALEIAAALKLRKVIAHEWLLVLGGVLSIVLAVCVAAYPGAGMVLLTWWLGAYAIAYGLVTAALTIRVKHWVDAHP